MNKLVKGNLVRGTGQAWMFDIDYLTDSLNYSRVSSTNLTVGSQGTTPSNAGSQKDDSDSDDEPDVLIIQSTPTPVVPIVDEVTTQNDGNEEADRLGLEFPSLNPILGVGTASISSSVSAGSTPQMSPCASPISADRHSSAAGKSPVSAGRPTGSAGRLVSAGRPTGSAGRPVSAGNLTSSVGRPVFAGRPSGSGARTPILADIHDGLKIFDCPKSGIFTSSSYDEEFSGPDENNLASSIDVSSTITKRIHNIHPTSQILGDINSPVQTRSQVKHKGTKWILKNKRDATGIVCRNKARLVAQGYRQEKWIDYTDIFAPVARIEAIRLFLAFASFIRFMVYQMDVQSAFLYEKIAEEVYVTQPRGFEDPYPPKKVYKVVKALYGLHQAPKAW
nr:putative ribonuclease H-like domain-containing protein [Tanacetum cinerariifolium]